MVLANRVRYYYFISGVFMNQQSDPLCGICKAFSSSVRSIREDLEEFVNSHALEISEMPKNLQRLITEAGKRLPQLSIAEDAVGQKKAGNCRLPEGVCLVKSSKGLRDRI